MRLAMIAQQQADVLGLFSITLTVVFLGLCGRDVLDALPYLWSSSISQIQSAVRCIDVALGRLSMLLFGYFRIATVALVTRLKLEWIYIENVALSCMGLWKAEYVYFVMRSLLVLFVLWTCVTVVYVVYRRFKEYKVSIEQITPIDVDVVDDCSTDNGSSDNSSAKIPKNPRRRDFRTLCVQSEIHREHLDLATMHHKWGHTLKCFTELFDLGNELKELNLDSKTRGSFKFPYGLYSVDMSNIPKDLEYRGERESEFVLLLISYVKGKLCLEQINVPVDRQGNGICKAVLLHHLVYLARALDCKKLAIPTVANDQLRDRLPLYGFKRKQHEGWVYEIPVLKWNLGVEALADLCITKKRRRKPKAIMDL